jgi:hypothetical protein
MRCNVDHNFQFVFETQSEQNGKWGFVEFRLIDCRTI